MLVAWLSDGARMLTVLSLVGLLAACAPEVADPRRSDQEVVPPPRGKTKTLTVGVTTGIQALGPVAGRSVGGWTSLTELHSDGLVTSDFTSRAPIARLAENVPSVEDGSISILLDGRMRVVYSLRRDVTWQDGAPFRAHDLVFSLAVLKDPGLPITLRDGATRIDAVEAVDDYTAAFTFTQPYYLGGALGVRSFWPQPRHLLEDAYQRYLATGSADEVANLGYWSAEFVHLGPFRVASFDPGEGIVLQAYPAYFLGRPAVDTVRVRAFGDENTLFANLLSGTVDLTPDTALNAELGHQLKQVWDGNGEGTVHVRPGATYFLSPQWRPWVQAEPANLAPRVRAALYQAIDREALSELVQPAWSLLPPGEQLYEATKDALRGYLYDPARSRAILAEVGWNTGPDGVLRNNADGRRFKNTISTVASGRLWEVAVYADYWRRIGLEVEEQQVPASQARNLEYRAHYPSWEATSSGQGDGILGRLTGPAASAENRWAGNRGGYEELATQQLLARYYASLTESEQMRAMRAISELVATELPMLIFYYNTDYLAVRRGVKAYDDVGGGSKGDRGFGTYSRNARLWDVP